MTMAAGLVRGDETKLAPNNTISFSAKLVHPVVSPAGDYLYWLNPSEGKLQRVALANNRLDDRAAGVAAGARDFCLSPDGTTAYVAATTNQYNRAHDRAQQHGTIQSINLANLTATASFDVAIDPLDMVANGHGFLYVTSGSGQSEKIHQIDPQQKKVLSEFGEIPGGSNLRITPDRQRLYLATNGVSPGNLSAIPVPTDSTSAKPAVVLRYHGEYPLGGAFDLTPDGKFAINRAGIVLRLDPAQEKDLLFVTMMTPNLGIACDPTAGKLWALQAGGHLLTYTYPGFALEKSEQLLNYGAALTYDASRKTLWVVWEGGTGGSGGLDAYNLASPAPYPNDITKARTPAAPAPVRREYKTTATTDPIVLGLIGLCVVLLLASIIFGRRDWPVPGGIKLVGWLNWFQVTLTLSVLVIVGLRGTTPASLMFGRVIAGIAVLLGVFAFGILRGNKICFVANAVLQIGVLVLSIFGGAKPGLLGVIVVFAIIHYGRKEWDSLT